MTPENWSHCDILRAPSDAIERRYETFDAMMACKDFFKGGASLDNYRRLEAEHRAVVQEWRRLHDMHRASRAAEDAALDAIERARG